MSRLNDILSDIKEEWVDNVETMMNTRVDVFKNPSKSDLIEIKPDIIKFTILKLDEGIEVYVWNGSSGLHHGEFRKKFGFSQEYSFVDGVAGSLVLGGKIGGFKYITGNEGLAEGIFKGDFDRDLKVYFDIEGLKDALKNKWKYL